MAYFGDRYAGLRFPLAPSSTDEGLRGAQVAAAHALSAHFFGHRDPAIVIMPTGSGKTVVMMLAAVLLRAARVLVVTPSRMVREQVAHHFATLHVLRKAGAMASDIPLPRVKQLAERPKTAAEWEALREKDVIVSTIQSVSPAIPGAITRPADLFDLVLWDEAHHTPAPSWRALLEGFSSARHALFTATPFRRDGKLIKGQIVFDYPLGRAREDGVFGRLVFQPVATTAPEGSPDADLAIARATERQFDRDRKAGLDHLVMVRTSTRTRAEELAKLYEAKTRLRLRTLFGSHSRSRLLDAIDKLKRGDLDGVVCVDMLGEGFDLPSLKIAALHSPHKSLAVTLQFLGRFARTTAAKTGDATFLAVPQEIQSEAAELYRVGAEWNEIVEEASRARIQAEQEVRDLAASFAPVSTTPTVSASDDEPIDLASLWPFFHVKVLEVPSGVDFDRPLAVPAPEDIILLEKSDDHSAVVCITRHVEEARWSDDPRLSNVHHDLFVLFYDAASKFLFLCSSRREMGVYDALVESIALGPERRLTPAELNRVLRGVENASFFSIGMRNRSGFGNGESYRITTGPAADRSVQKSDGRYYDRGHCFGKGEEGGTPITIGFSSASKVWANANGRLHELFRWCTALARKLRDATPVLTRSNLDHLPLSERAASIPDPLVNAAWGDEIYSRPDLRLHWIDTDGDEQSLALLDATVEIVTSTPAEAEVAVRGPGLDLRYLFRIDRPRWFEAKDSQAAAVRYVDGMGDAGGTLLDLLHDSPPAFFSATLARLDGDVLAPAPVAYMPFDPARIETIDWAAAKVDPLVEKGQGGAQRSLFEWLEERLVAGAADVIFNDDDTGEIADFVALYARGAGATLVELYHCKAAGGRPVPGKRVEDVYEVAGQAIKSLRIMRPGALRTHLIRRAAETVAGARRFVRGDRATLERVLADRVALSFEVTIVQPGIGRTSGDAVGNVLAAANSYMAAGSASELRIIGA
jgi:superfamily II DNA or RNA helicase